MSVGVQKFLTSEAFSLLPLLSFAISCFSWPRRQKIVNKENIGQLTCIVVFQIQTTLLLIVCYVLDCFQYDHSIPWIGIQNHWCQACC